MEFYQCITDFIFIEQEPEPADVIFVPGGNYPDSARWAATLYQKGLAPYVLPSGRYSILKGKFEADLTADQARILNIERVHTSDEKRSTYIDMSFETEWEYLRQILMDGGVPEERILKEDQATYTYENAIYSVQVLKDAGIQVKKAILCCQAFHARRCLMYYQEQFPDVEFLVCPVVTKGISRENWFQTEKGIETVLGEMERCGGQFHEIMRRRL